MFKMASINFELPKEMMDIVYKRMMNHYYSVTNQYTTKPGTVENLQKFCSRQLLSKQLGEATKQFLTLKSDDEKIVEILKFVVKRITYTPDLTKWKVPEMWEDAENVYNTYTGDCESGALLILTLARMSGIQPEKIYLVAGDVLNGKVKEGHAWILYISDNGKIKVIDWCYWPDLKAIKYRVNYEDLKHKYLTEWFRVNDSYSLGSLKPSQIRYK